jgi:hypothetical protein
VNFSVYKYFSDKFRLTQRIQIIQHDDPFFYVVNNIVPIAPNLVAFTLFAHQKAYCNVLMIYNLESNSIVFHGLCSNFFFDALHEKIRVVKPIFDLPPANLDDIYSKYLKDDRCNYTFSLKDIENNNYSNSENDNTTISYSNY